MSRNHAHGSSPSKKEKLNKKIRIAERDGQRCVYCGDAFTGAEWYEKATLDHYIPISRLRGWRVLNLVLSCEPCNNLKGDAYPSEDTRWYLPSMIPLLRELLDEYEAEAKPIHWEVRRFVLSRAMTT